MSTQRWTALMVGPDNGILAPEGTKFKGHPEHYDRIDVVPAAEAEKLRAELAEWQELHVKQAELNADLRAELAECRRDNERLHVAMCQSCVCLNNGETYRGHQIIRAALAEEET